MSKPLRAARSFDWEFYETPHAFTRYLFQMVPIAGLCLEPCVGRGAILEAAPQDGSITWQTNDLDPRWDASVHKDASDPAAWGDLSWDWIVSNPPFTNAFAIIEHALEHARVGVAMHLRASVHEVLKTGPRKSFMYENTPRGILWLPRFAYQRSKKTGRWTTDNMAACWVIWLKDNEAPQRIEYAPPRVVNELQAETPEYRARMDGISFREAAPV